MKASIPQCLALASAAIWLGGCDFTQMAAFRAQMRDVSEFTAWEGRDESVFVFKTPLLTLEDLGQIEIHPHVLNEHVAVLRYRRVNTPAGLPTVFEIRLLFSGGKLAGLVLPPALRDGLGRENITRLFAMIGGANGRRGGGMRPLPKAQLVAAGIFPASSEPLGREAVIFLMPADERNRPIYIKMTETKKPDYYSEFLISVKRRTE